MSQSTHTEPATEHSVELLDDPVALEGMSEEWRELARGSLEPNAFFEPAHLLSSLGSLPAEKDRVAVAVVWRRIRGDQELVGLVPIERRRGWRGIPVPVARLWKHRHCQLATPLLARRGAPEVLQALLEYLTGTGTTLVELEWVGFGGPFEDCLSEVLKRLELPHWIYDRFERPVYLRRESTQEQYMLDVVGGHRRRRLRRRVRQLTSEGSIRFVEQDPPEDPDRLVERFLALEASGWKGRQQTALAQEEGDRRFFERLIAAASGDGSLSALTLELDDRPIAIRTALRSGGTQFCLKTAFDERLSRYSPGALVEVEQIRIMLEDDLLAEADSCAISSSTPLAHLWAEEREIGSILVSGGGPLGELVLRSAPVLKQLKQELKESVS